MVGNHYYFFSRSNYFTVFQQNPISCPYNCDVRVKNERHDPTRMVDGVKWTWWQSTRFGMSSQSAAVNITFSLPKRFILTGKLNYKTGVLKPKQSNRLEAQTEERPASKLPPQKNKDFCICVVRQTQSVAYA